MKKVKVKSNKLPLIWGLLPSFATLIGLVWLDQALLAVLLYHAGIVVCLIWKRFPLAQLSKGFHLGSFVILTALCLLTWPLVQLLWPLMVLPDVSLSDLLLKWRITGPTVWIFVFYSITLHPILEESFWRGLMPDTWKSDALFAAFHLIVMYSLVDWMWLPLAFLVLTFASTIWRRVVKVNRGLTVPTLTHAIADLGVNLAVRILLR